MRYGRYLRVDDDSLDRADGWFRRYGDWVVLFARVVPFARSVVSIPAGTMKMPVVRFAALTALGSLVWNSLLIGAGVILGANWQRVEAWIGSYSNAILVATALTVAVALALRHSQKMR